MRFDRQPPDRRAGRHSPPPNYLASASQLRLLTMVGLLLLVLYLMNEARKPERWAWMWGGRLPAATQQPAGGTYEVLIHEPPGKRQPENTQTRIWRDAWGHILRTLPSSERAALDRLLWATRRQAVLSEEDRIAGRAAMPKLCQLWEEFLQDARSSLDDRVPVAQRDRWRAELAKAEVEWQEQVLPALQTPLDGDAVNSEQRQVLERVQAVLDAIALDAIRDDTVWRAAEQAAWSRLVEELQTRDEQHLRRESRGIVGYAALLRQPEVYRGKLVTVRGSVRMAYRSPAPPNTLGIEQHYVLWLRLQAGPDLPLVVYALDLPAGFPAVKPRDSQGRGTDLDEEVEVTGYFFKRWVYAARDDLRSVPLILAAAPCWLGRPPSATENDAPSRSTIAAWLLGVVAASGGLVLWAYRATRRGSRVGIEPRQIAPPLSATQPTGAAEQPP